MQLQDSKSELRASYGAVSNRTWLHSDFQSDNLKISRDLFTADSIAARSPRPKELEVVALLAGLPFGDDIVGPLVRAQHQLSEVIGDALHYWVAPENLGLEFCVFKWPDEPWQEAQRAPIESAVQAVRATAFRFEIGGIQINPDGCVIARGYDPDGEFFSVREQMKSALPFLPKRQSGWAHVPLGRILEPLGEERFAALGRVTQSLVDAPVADTVVDAIRLIRESRWYMEERTTLMERKLESGAVDE